MYQPKSYRSFLAVAASAALVADTMSQTLNEKKGLGKSKPSYPVEMRKRIQKRRSHNKQARQSRKKNR